MATGGNTGDNSDQVIDLTLEDESISDFQYAMMLQEQEIANAESILTEPMEGSFSPIAHSGRSPQRRQVISLRYHPFPMLSADPFADPFADSFDDSYEVLEF